MSRIARQQRRKTLSNVRLGRYAVAAVVVVAVAAAAVAVAGGLRLYGDRRQARDLHESTPVLSSVALASTPMTGTASVVEVPDLIGRTLEEAGIVLKAAGFVIEVREAGVAKGAVGSDRPVTSQDPVAGTLGAAGDAVIIFVGAQQGQAATSSSSWVVCIDPGHQAEGDDSPEPVGPGSKTTKPAVTGGTTGVKTGVPEYEIALQISMNLKRELESRGVKVVMTRTTNDVELTNAQRAEVANKSKADIFVRVHGGGSPDSAQSGVCTLFPVSNAWTKPIAARSQAAARSVQSAVVDSTGALDRGATGRGDVTGFNWSRVPSILVECGYLSNPVEDRLLASPHYQEKLARGIADGVMAYLESAEGR